MKKSHVLITAIIGGMVVGLATSFSVKKANKEFKVGDIIGGVKQIVAINDNPTKIRRKPLVVPTDTYYSKQKTYSMSSVGDIETTWDYYKGDGIKIAIIDSGITYGHEDFPNLLDESAYFETEYTQVGYQWKSTTTMTLATSDNWACMKHEYDTSYREWDTHGSNVAGCAAAALNGVGTVGIAPNAQILMCKIDFYDESINEAIKYATDQGCDVINMSLGAYDDEDYPSGKSHGEGVKEGNADAIAYAINHGVIVVAAAGNESSNSYSYPACNNGVIGAGALAKNSTTSAADFSNYNKSTDTKNGNHNVDIMAPGVVWAPGLDGDQLTTKGKNNYPDLGYGETQGTSFASPIVAGAAALWKQKYHGTPAQFEQDLYDRAVNMGNFTKYGNGRLDVYKLLDIEHEGFALSTNSLSLNTRSTDQVVSATSNTSTIKSWVSSNTNVVTVSGTTGAASGTATIHVVGAGTATITVTANDNSTATISVTVSSYVAVTGITTTATSGAEVGQGKTLSIGASVTPSNASEKGITYTSQNTSVATVNSSGVITGVSIGSTIITMNAADDVSATFNVTVVENHSVEYSIVFADSGKSTDQTQDKASSLNTIVKSSTITLSSSSGSKVYLAKSGYGIKFSSSSVDGYLNLTLSKSAYIEKVIANAAKYGSDSSKLSINDLTSQTLSSDFADYTFDINSEVSTISIDATKRLYLKSLTVVVSDSGSTTVNVSGVTVSPTSLTLNTIGATSSLTATISPSNATNKNVSWSSDDESVATVSDTGVVTATGNGTCNVTVTTEDGNKTATCLVTVSVIETITPISSFYDGTITLKTGRSSLTSDDWYDFEGVVVGINGYQYYVQDGEYGILVYNESNYLYTYYENIAVGDHVKLHSRVYSYNGLVETNSRDDSQTVKKLGTSSLPEAAEFTTVSSFLSAHQSIRASLFNVSVDSANVETIAAFDSTTTKDYSFKVCDVNNISDTLTVFISKNAPERANIISKLKTITTDDTVEFLRCVVAYYNGNQISLSSADQIVIHSPSEDKLAAWGVNYLFIGNPAFDGNGTGTCKTANYYKEAKSALLALEVEEAGVIETLQSDSTYSAELARYLAWAKACEDSLPFVDDFMFINNANVGALTDNIDNNTILIVIIISAISTLAFATLLVFKKKRK